MKDFFTFKRMLTPMLIQVLMILGVVTLILTGLVGIFYQHEILKGLIIIVFGPIAVRLVAELLVLFFRLNETLTDIYHAVRQIESHKK